MVPGRGRLRWSRSAPRPGSPGVMCAPSLRVFFQFFFSVFFSFLTVSKEKEETTKKTGKKKSVDG